MNSKLPSILLFASAFVGTVMASTAFAQNTVPNDKNGSVQKWGARGISLQMTAEGANVEFDCAQGRIFQPIQPNASGEFSLAGTYTAQRGGPVQKNSTSTGVPATYKGTINGATMNLQIILSDGSQLPPFTLTRGSAGRLIKCR